MPGTDVAPINLDFYVPVFEVTINGKGLQADISKAIIDVSVSESLNQASRFNLTVNNQSLKWHDHPLFKIGNEVAIKLGYVNNLRDMILGKIKDVQVSFPASGASTLRVSGLDFLDEVLRGHAKKTYPLEEASYSEAVDAIAGASKLQSKIDPIPDKQPKIFIRKGDAFKPFMDDLARRLDFRFYTRGRTLHFRKRKAQSGIVTLTWGKNLIQFTPHLSLNHQLTKVEVRGYNPTTKEPIIGVATSGDIEKTESGGTSGSDMLQAAKTERVKVITNRPVFTKAEAEKIAKAELNKANAELVTGDGSCVGLPGLRPDDYVELEGLGQRFSGKYQVASVTHTFNNSGYITSFNLKRNSSNEPA